MPPSDLSPSLAEGRGRVRPITEIILHCTATFADQPVTVELLRRWHRQRGFKDIGYHYLIDLDGRILPGRPESAIGAHCKGHNAHSIGVAYAGGLAADGRPADTRNPAQKAALLTLLKDLRHRYPQATIHSHSDFSPKACPCFDASAEYGSI